MSDEVEAFLKAAIGVGLLALVVVVLSTVMGCSSNIPIDPDCGRLIEVQDEELLSYECSRPVEDCTDEYNEGYEDGASSVTCEECREPGECPEPPSCDSYGDDVPRGHLPKECRGKHRAQLDDDECGDDPICPLELARRVCRTVCNTTPYGGTECYTQCWEDGRPV